MPRAAAVLPGAGPARVVVAAGVPLSAGATLAISIEPAGGSQTPNLPPVALFDFSQAT